MTRIFYFIALLLVCISIQAQEKTIYFDAEMKVVKNKAKAIQYAVVQSEEHGGKLVDFHTMDGKLIRSSQYKTFAGEESKNIRHGATHYKFSCSDQDSLMVFYRDNKKYGGATFYYLNGEVMASCQYNEGELNGLLKQFYENGTLKRLEMYENNTSVSGKYLAPDSTELPFSPFYKAAEYNNNLSELKSLITRNISLTTNLVKDISEKGMSGFDFKVGIEVNESGKVQNIVILENEHPMFSKKCLEKVVPALKDYTFVPAQMNDQSVPDLFILKDHFTIRISPTRSTITRVN